MAQTSSFFKSISGDRTYTADKFAEYFRNFLTTGIKNGGTNLEVEEQTPNALGVQVKSGTALIQGYYYNNSATFPLTLATADAVNPRIDRIILRLNINDGVRSIVLAVLTGTPAGSPTAPALETDFAGTGIHEISLAQVEVLANATTIANAKITDERLDEEVCGLINSLITYTPTYTWNTQSKSSTYTALSTDDIIFCTGTFTLSLPEASTWTKPLTVKNIGTGIITIDADGTETIDGELTRILTEQMYVVLMSDGTNIHRIGG